MMRELCALLPACNGNLQMAQVTRVFVELQVPPLPTFRSVVVGYVGMPAKLYLRTQPCDPLNKNSESAVT